MRALVTLPFCLAVAGCAAQKPMFRARVVTVGAGSTGKPERLTRSLFHKPADRDNLSEEVIQRVINAPLLPELPARAGVVVLDAPFSRKSYTALIPGDRAPQLLARRLERDRHFVMVSDISPHLVHGQSIEAIRELATRYRLKYLVIFNRRFDDDTRLNGWGWSWLSLVGIPFAPAYTYRARGILEATLMDVRTGTFLFTTQVHIEATRRSTPWSEERKLAEMELAAGRRAARHLSRRFLAKCRRLVRHARALREAPQASRARRAKLQEGRVPVASAHQLEAQREPRGGEAAGNSGGVGAPEGREDRN
jgi:hypothetical protein